MEKNILYLYLERVSCGDKSYLKRLCRQISDKVVFVPVEDSSEEEGTLQKIKVTLCQSRSFLSGKAIPVFTNKELFAEWATVRGHTRGVIQVLCGDLCIALGKSGTIQIDPGKAYSVKIPADDFELISREAENEICALEEEFKSYPSLSEA